MGRDTPIPYGLYQTLSGGIQPKKLTAVQKRELAKHLNSVPDSQAEAVLMLVCEHARVSGDFDYDPENLLLPYGLTTDNPMVFDLAKLPAPLRQILWKFKNITPK